MKLKRILSMTLVIAMAFLCLPQAAHAQSSFESAYYMDYVYGVSGDFRPALQNRLAEIWRSQPIKSENGTVWPRNLEVEIAEGNWMEYSNLCTFYSEYRYHKL